MERKNMRDPYREQGAETWRRNESEDPDHRRQGRSERQQFSEHARLEGQSFEAGREAWDVESGRAIGEGGRQYEGGGGYGYGRQGYTPAQTEGYYRTRPTTEQSGIGYAGGQYARSGVDYGYGGLGYTGGPRPMGQGPGIGYAGRENRGEPTGQYSGRGPRNYMRSDERIQEDVCHRLTEDPAVDASNIEVVVSNREVTLLGTVPSREQRRRAEECAEQVAGVAHVQNNTRVLRSESWAQSSDRSYEIPRDETDSLISSDKVEGTAVYGADRQKIGSIESVMLTKRGGKVAYAVLSFGGFLGLGTEHYPLPWSVLKYDTGLSGYVVNLTKDQLQAAPKYGQNDSWDWNDPGTTRRIDQYYSPWMGMIY
jgi:hypothetical protein